MEWRRKKKNETLKTTEPHLVSLVLTLRQNQIYIFLVLIFFNIASFLHFVRVICDMFHEFQSSSFDGIRREIPAKEKAPKTLITQFRCFFFFYSLCFLIPIELNRNRNPWLQHIHSVRFHFNWFFFSGKFVNTIIIIIEYQLQHDGKTTARRKQQKKITSWNDSIEIKERTTHQMLFVPICFFSSFSWMRNFVSQLSQRFINSSIYTLNWLPVIYRFPFNSKWTNWHLNLSLEWPRERIRYTDRTPQNKAKYPEWRRL